MTLEEAIKHAEDVAEEKNRDLAYRIFIDGGTNAGPFYDAYENDPNIIDSTATEIIEEEEIKEQHDRDITYLPDHRRAI